ncbi:MAG: EutN/CcmL family microcompartment protein [Lachnospiraceae bacterium]|nr:EutN/CcmL family microcompartment protein [Lachnospiraceae bacterium]
MQLARVVGTVVSTTKSEKIMGLKMLLVKPIDIETFEEKGNILVAFDAVGAGEGEVVMIVSGSSSRQTVLTENKPSDTAIIAIIDYVDYRNKRIFSKFEPENKPKKE